MYHNQTFGWKLTKIKLPKKSITYQVGRTVVPMKSISAPPTTPVVNQSPIKLITIRSVEASQYLTKISDRMNVTPCRLSCNVRSAAASYNNSIQQQR